MAEDLTPWHTGPKKTVLFAVLLGVLAVALFSQAIGYGFVNYDDDAYVYENPHVLRGLDGPGIQYALSTGDIGTWAPLTWISYELDTTVQGPRASSYHLTNILLHAAAGALLFIALKRMLQSLWVSITVAVIFLFHPLRTESVVWIAERKDVLCSFFWMLGLVAYTSYAREPNRRRWAAVYLCFLAGLMSKMMMVTFPFVLLLLDFWPLNRGRCNGVTDWKLIRQLIVEKIPFLVGSVLALFISATALHARGAFGARPNSGLHDLLRVPGNYLFYLWKLFWPTRLSVLYPIESVRHHVVILSVAVLIVITIVSLWQARTKPWLVVGWLWFVGVLIPVVGFVPFGDFTVADRYTYIPSIGVTWALAAATEYAPGRYAVARWFGTGVVGIACVCATLADLPRWRDSVTLYNSALQIGPHYVAYSNRGVELLRAGNAQGAIDDFNSAISLNTNFSRAYNNRAGVLCDLGKYDEALQDLDKAIERDPFLADAYDTRGNTLARKGEPQKALADYDRSLKLKPTRPMTYNNRASAYFQLRRFSEAMADIEQCRRNGGQPHPGLVQALTSALPQ